MSELEKDEFYNKDLIGCSVFSEESKCFGKIVRILETKSGALLEVYNNNTTYLIPLNKSFVMAININDKALVIKNLEKIASL
ncbi:MAG TPA: 16S rRNA processing protein RimM [Candidatus Dadabacteria bacterium]|jgi:16S rRNA processing protein RimM|nr:16S rRNA processing protein RimM [Candidatus Dadabacteria bacterium]